MISKHWCCVKRKSNKLTGNERIARIFERMLLQTSIAFCHILNMLHQLSAHLSVITFEKTKERITFAAYVAQMNYSKLFLILSGLFAFVFCPVKAQVLTQLVAGSNSAMLQDGTGAGASFKIPVGIDFDPAGNLCIGDDQNHAIRKITPAGVVTTIAGNGTTGMNNGTGSTATFNRPHEICTDALGNIYVADNNNYVIRKVTPLGVTTTFAGTGANGYVDGPGNVAEFSEITGLCIDNAGNLYASDRFNNVIRKITPAGIVSTVAGNGSNGITNGPALGASIGRPWGLDFHEDKVYIAQFDHHIVRVLDILTNTVSTFAGTGTSGNTNGNRLSATFNGPVSIEITNSGVVYISDYFNHSIREISPAGNVTTLVGLGTAGYLEGTSLTALLNMPLGMAYNNSTSELFFTDRLNNRIRKITCAGFGVSIFPDDTVHLCNNGSLQLQAPSGMDNYLWNTNETTDHIDVTTPGMYRLTVQQDACIASDSVRVITSISPLDLGPDTIYCAGETMSLSAIGFSSYLWSTGETNSSILALDSGLYFVHASDVSGCHLGDSILIEWKDKPLVSLGNDTSLCPGDTYVLDVTYPGVTYSWQDHSTTPQYIITTGGLYHVRVDNAGCSVSDSVEISQSTFPVVNIGPDTTMCSGGELMLSAHNAGAAYLWNDLSSQPFYPVTEPGIYHVSVSNACATITDSITVEFAECICNLFIPNSFTPNNDKVNDWFFPVVSCNMNEFEFSIFDRWGKQLFYTKSIDSRWSGLNKEGQIPAGVYVYKITYRFDNALSQSETITGKICLLR